MDVENINLADMSRLLTKIFNLFAKANKFGDSQMRAIHNMWTERAKEMKEAISNSKSTPRGSMFFFMLLLI